MPCAKSAERGRGMGASWRQGLSYVGVAVVAFAISGGVARAAPAIDVFRLADGNNATHLAAVDASGNLGVAGTVNVGNLPATQSVTGTVGIGAAANTVRLDPSGNAVTVANL